MEPVYSWWALMVSAIGSFIGAFGGVLLRRQHKAQQGDAQAWSRLWVDAPTVFVMGLAGAGVGQWLTSSYGMPELFGHILSAILGYLGPAAIDRIVDIAARKAGEDKTPKG